MSAEKRNVSTDALASLGMVIDETAKRGAIHLAVEPCIAGEKLYPGMDIGILGGVGISTATKKLGIVDPFLKHPINEGQRFWLIVYPRQITSLRHVWEHPDFPDSKSNSKAVSEKWLRDFCINNDCPNYETLIAGAVNASDDEYLHFNDSDAHGEIPDEFWVHVENVTGRTLDTKPKYFSCSC